MSNQYEKCVICGENTLISQTNMDEDLGFLEINDKIICPDCIQEIKGDST